MYKTMGTDTRYIGTEEPSEVYITASPRSLARAQEQSEEVFADIREVLKSTAAWIMQERIFAARGAMATVSQVRAEVYGELDDGVAPSYLLVPEGKHGPIAGVQVHAIRTPHRLEVLRSNGAACGRILRRGDVGYVALSGLSAPEAGSATAQAREMLEKGDRVLRQAGADIRLVARTWMWLADILSWYDDFNRVRNVFFSEQGILADPDPSLPASTGIGIGPATGARCAMDLIAVLGPPGSIRYLLEGGNQGSAYHYGSAFSRASWAKTPAGATVYISGTAAIDANGTTQHVGDMAAQIDVTLDHVRAVLRDMNCRDEDVVQAFAYCKTREVEEHFLARRSRLPWPVLTMICDICRPDLFFEMEATAVPGAKKV